MNNAPAGARLLLDPTGVYTGNFSVPKSLELWSAGTIPNRRVTAADSGSFPVIRAANNTQAMYVPPAIDNVGFKGLQFDPATSGDEGVHMILGDNLETDVADVPDTIAVDKCLFIGNPAGGTKRGIAIHASNVTVDDTSILDIKCDRADVSETQAIWVMNTQGPVSIRNTRMQASGENFLSGGDTMRLPDVNTTGILLEDCLLDKPLEWQGLAWNVKNTLEIKQGIDVMINRCVLDGCWADGQSGYALMLTPKNQNGLSDWTKVANVTFQNSIIRNAGGGWNLAGDDLENGPAERTDGIYILNNLMLLNNTLYGEPGAGKVWTLTQGPANVHIIHNTCLNNGNSIADYDDGAGDRDTIVGVHKINYNIFQHNSTGIRSNESNNATVNLDRFAPDGYEFITNVISGAPSSNYPGVTTIRPTTGNFATYVDIDTGELLVGSPYIGAGDGGSDLGCNFALLSTE